MRIQRADIKRVVGVVCRLERRRFKAKVHKPSHEAVSRIIELDVSCNVVDVLHVEISSMRKVENGCALSYIASEIEIGTVICGCLGFKFERVLHSQHAAATERSWTKNFSMNNRKFQESKHQSFQIQSHVS